MIEEALASRLATTARPATLAPTTLTEPLAVPLQQRVGTALLGMSQDGRYASPTLLRSPLTQVALITDAVRYTHSVASSLLCR